MLQQKIHDQKHSLFIRRFLDWEWKVLLSLFLGTISFLTGFLPETTWGGPFDPDLKIAVSSSVSTKPDPEAAFFRAGNRKGGEAPDEYFDKIQPIIGRRCTVCHGCENSPCSLKLVSYMGLQRGGTQIGNQTSLAVRGYEAIRLKDGPLLGTIDEWKDAWQKNRPEDQRFHSVAPDSNGTDAEQSLIYQFLKQGNDNNKPGFDRTKVRQMEQERYDGGATMCVADPTEYGKWKAKYPEGGMPFGCPGLKKLSEGGYGAGEFDTMETWIKKGAPGPGAEAVADHATSSDLPTIERWERYLNIRTNKQMLVSRYLFEHLFRAHIHFAESPGEFYMIVRASNPPADYPVREIVTKAPNDPPTGLAAGAPFYYRLNKITDLVAIKDHIIWEADNKTLERIRHLFNEESPKWGVLALPGYEGKNPFLYFQAIPPSIRYKFLLENSRFFLDNLTRSPVCNGSKATFAMDDYVWAWFLKPEADPTAQDRGPAAFGTTEWNLVNDGYRVNIQYIQGTQALAKHNDRYLTELEKRQRILRPGGLRVDDVWNGSCLFDPQTNSKERNPNAWVSAIRHETNASTLFGGEGGNPIAVYLFNFSNFERAFYSLSFNYKEWGTLQHKLLTWRDFMHVRIEAEDRFLSLLEPNTRTAIRNDWSSGVGGQAGLKMFPDRSLGTEGIIADLGKKLPGDSSGALNGVRPGDSTLKISEGAAPRDAFLSVVDQIVERRFPNWKAGPTSYNDEKKPNSFPTQVNSKEDLEAVMAMVTQRSGFYNSRIPSVSYIRIQPQGWIYTMVAHRRYSSHNYISDVLWARSGQSVYDYTSIYPGIVGDYPNLFFDVPLERAREFFGNLVKVKTNEEWLPLRSRFMVHKNVDAFWETVDWFHTWMAENMPITGGILDLREYDNWEIPPESKED
ncbi:MAG: fatty acid cis/trans isomerase [Candidatus Riflebacteria bacterium]|nr:fatty acid cis/trans isomerase [Candidatus Riflebacteria bacterium]